MDMSKMPLAQHVSDETATDETPTFDTSAEIDKVCKKLQALSDNVSSVISELQSCIDQCHEEIQVDMVRIDNDLADGTDFGLFTTHDVAVSKSMAALQAISERLIEAEAHARYASNTYALFNKTFNNRDKTNED